MRIVSLLFVFLWISLVSGQGSGTEERQKIPTTLSEAHVELERLLSPEELAEIDAMPSEDDMIEYHFSLGLNIRNGWGLWRGSPLAEHMRELGFTDPDIMSSVILQTFWCKRHGQDFRLNERAAEYKKYRDGAWKVQVQRKEEERVRKDKMRIRNIMMMAFLSAVLLTSGLVCWIFARISLYKRGSMPSLGIGLMSKGHASLSKIAHVLMVVGVLLLLLLLGLLQVKVNGVTY